MSTMRVIKVVFPDGSVREVSTDEVLSKCRRDGEVIVLDRETIHPRASSYVFPRLVEYDGRQFINVFKNYVGKDRPRLYPRFEVEELGTDYMIVMRRDGVLFKVADPNSAEVLGNIYANAGISLSDLITLELTIYAKESPNEFEKDPEYPTALVTFIVDTVGFFAYVADLVELHF